ncbi:unnamed protein product [Dracunculus medinensis]|uniref:EGF-like domain-containing protein n=1 Tax=Dracunculus medinensis TaxID=318479 RepID=A0A0N4U5E5_DRAME|nr:unnamed protein product [Dracunculus medinensis]
MTKTQLKILKGYCPNKQISQIRCTKSHHCASDQICLNGICCTATGNEQNYACGGTTALGRCDNGFCPRNTTCTASSYCCECPFGKHGGRCNQGVCPSGFQCLSNGYCCPYCGHNHNLYGVCINDGCSDNSQCHPGNICCQSRT